MRGSCAHVMQSKAFTFRQAGTGDSRSIIFYFKNEIRRFPAKPHAYHGRLGVANGVADRLLGQNAAAHVVSSEANFLPVCWRIGNHSATDPQRSSAQPNVATS